MTHERPYRQCVRTGEFIRYPVLAGYTPEPLFPAVRAVLEAAAVLFGLTGFLFLMIGLTGAIR